MTERHAFVVLAYGQSPYLEECLASLGAQTVPSPIIVSTSTPFDGLRELCERHGATLRVHGPNRGIGADWNAGLQAASGARLVTLAHQDDLYRPDFTRRVLEAHDASPAAAFSFCDTDEVWPDGRTRAGRNHRIKEFLVNVATAFTSRVEGRMRRQVLLGFGNPLICATVTFNRATVPGFAFREDLRTNMDWLAWIDLSRRSAIVRIRRPLLMRRVHEASETAQCLRDGTREAEDRMVFSTLWPRPVANVIASVYRHSYQGYLN
jgi:glycosyltransferase involved in cell wall biosynthesis